MVSDWFDNDELFVDELHEGHRQAERVAASLRQHDLNVLVTPLRLRDGIENRGEFADEYDLTVGNIRPCIIDVKSRDLRFSGPQDYPYPTALVDTVSGWHQKTHKPVAIVLVSQSTGAMAVIRATSEPHWTSRRRFDRRRQIHDEFLEIKIDELATFDELVDWLLKREARLRSSQEP